jgi:4-hydroxymandelate oxidase
MTGSETPGFTTLSDLEETAARRSSPTAWAYAQGGSGDERTLRANLEAFHRRALRPRVLSPTASVDLATTVLGQRVAAPVFACPTAYHGLFHADAEAATARAARDHGLLAVFSTLSTLSMEAIAEAAPDGVRWFQLYLQPDPERNERLVARAERAGFRAIVLTADTPLLAIRDRQRLGGFDFDRSPPIGNATTPPPRRMERDGTRYSVRDTTFGSWATLDRLRGRASLPWVVKGILTPEDARLAVEHGAAAILVSNHGGRQLDGAPASLDALPEIRRAVGDRVEVYLDGGVRRGSDVLISLASGARAVGVGRPILWALAAGGFAGVSRYFELLLEETASAAALLGRGNPRELDESAIGRAGIG